MIRTVSNEVPEHPVLSPVSGSIFERRLIEKYVADNRVDPINGKTLTVDQLIDIKGIGFFELFAIAVASRASSPFIRLR